MNLWFQAIFSNLFSLKMVKQLFKRWKNGTNLGNLWIQSSMFLLKLFRWASIKYLSNSSFFLVFAPDDQLQLVLRWEGNLVSILVIPNPQQFFTANFRSIKSASSILDCLIISNLFWMVYFLSKMPLFHDIVANI